MSDVEKKTRKYLDASVLARLGGIPLTSRKPMLGQVSGRHTSPHRGASVEFAEYRKYVPGDDLRRLDWRAYGRSDRYFVKEFEADTNLRCVLVVDSSGSMDFSSVGVSKLEYALKVASTLAYILIEQGDAVGLASVAEKIVQQIPAKRNPAHLSLLLDTMEKVQPQGETNLVEILHELAETTRQRALVLIFSDLFQPPDELKNCFEHLRFRKHDVAAFHLLDPEELSFPFQRPTRFLDLEGGTAVFAEPTEIADRYHRALEGYLDQIREIVLQTGVDYRQHSIDQPFDQAVSQFLVDRSTGGSSR